MIKRNQTGIITTNITLINISQNRIMLYISTLWPRKAFCFKEKIPLRRILLFAIDLCLIQLIFDPTLVHLALIVVIELQYHTIDIVLIINNVYIETEIIWGFFVDVDIVVLAIVGVVGIGNIIDITNAIL